MTDIFWTVSLLFKLFLSMGHIARDCNNEPVCSFCKQSGHSRNNCEQYITEKARRDYGSYASEILEGQQTVSTKIGGVVYRPTIFTFYAIVVGKDSNFKATEIGFIW
jgi:hypothetical protein